MRDLFGTVVETRTDVSSASRTVEVPFGAAWPSFADAPPCPDPPVVCPGFGLGRFQQRKSDLSNPKPGHTPGGTVRGGPGGTAAPGGDGQHRTPTTGVFAQGKPNSLTSQTMEEYPPWCAFGSTNKGNPI